MNNAKNGPMSKQDPLPAMLCLHIQSSQAADKVPGPLLLELDLLVLEMRQDAVHLALHRRAHELA